MNDADIIKALECCITKKCNKCPFRAMNCSAKVVMVYTIDLIKRQQAEIERLHGDLDKSIGIDNTGSNLFPFD